MMSLRADATDRVASREYDYVVIAIVAVQAIIGTAFFALADWKQPAFWTAEAKALRPWVDALIICCACFFVTYIVLDRKFRRSLPEFITKLVFVAMGMSYTLLLYKLIERTHGLILSPFSEFYGAILLTVVILATRTSWVPWVMGLGVLGAVIAHCVLGDLGGGAFSISRPLQELVSDSAYHRWHAGVFLFVLAAVFVVDFARDWSWDKRLRDCQAEVRTLVAKVGKCRGCKERPKGTPAPAKGDRRRPKKKPEQAPAATESHEP
jgi:hypothetical protein